LGFWDFGILGFWDFGILGFWDFGGFVKIGSDVGTAALGCPPGRARLVFLNANSPDLAGAALRRCDEIYEGVWAF
jgi:hypothetical protein